MGAPRVITLDDAKGQLRLTDSQTHLDDLLETQAMAAAERTAEQFLNRTLESLDRSSPQGADSPYDVEENIKAGILYYLEADFSRDPKTLTLYVDRAEKLLQPYRVSLGV